MDDSIKKWAKDIDWDKRIKAVCKPCWELKYCPYGPVVEDFPLESKRTEKSCRIYGHNCPVFYCAEPFTETKELRSITRSIPNHVITRVNRRDNGICQECLKPVKECDIHYDHIIPFSKGGSSDENNIRVLCKECNLKRGNDFENQYLISNTHERLSGLIPLNHEMLLGIMQVLMYKNIFNKDKIIINFQNIIKNISFDEEAKNTIKPIFEIIIYDIDSLHESENFNILNKKEKEIFDYRYSYKDEKIHSYNEILEKYRVSLEKVLLIEKKYFNYIGFDLSIVGSNLEKITNDEKMVAFIMKDVEANYIKLKEFNQ